MSFMHELADVFDSAFAQYEKNRMYPPVNRKDPAMRKLELKHSEAIGLAKAHMIKLLDRETSPRWKVYVEGQITLLNEVNWFILHTIYNPGLPFEGEPHGTFELRDKEGKDNKPEG